MPQTGDEYDRTNLQTIQSDNYRAVYGRNDHTNNTLPEMDGVEAEPVTPLQLVAKAKKKRNLQPVAEKPQTKKTKRLRPKSMKGHLWKPDGLTGWSLYRRQPSKSKNGKDSSKQKYIGYYSQDAVERQNNVTKKKAKS